MQFGSDSAAAASWSIDSLPEEAFLELGIQQCADRMTRAGNAVGIVDPLANILSPDFTAPLWEYEESRIDPFVPGNLHPKQAEALESGKRHRWLFWGNQAGKTTLGAIEVVLLALGRHPTHQYWEPPIVEWASALTWELWENVLLPELLTWIPEDRIVDAPQPYQKSTKRVIKILADNGKISRIEGKSAEQGPAKYQSRRLHAVWFDEEHPEVIYDEVLPRLVRHGGITLTTATPLKGLTWIYDRIYQPWKEGKEEAGSHFCSHAGMADNPGIPSEEIKELTRELRHNPSLLAARLHGRFMRPQGLVVSNFDPVGNTVEIDELTLTTMLARGQLYAGIDFGWWRFAFVLGLVDRAGRMHLIQEIFSTNEVSDERAKQIHELLQDNGAPSYMSIWGDAANPQDIAELNAAFVRIGSNYRVIPVAMENKIRRVGADRIRSLFKRKALWVRRGLAQGQVWRLGRGAGKEGVPVEGSRLLWEINNWAYPKKPDEKHQKDDPDDTTADGADMMSALRYLVMSWWKGPTYETPPPKGAWDPRVLKEEAERLQRGELPPNYRRRSRRRVRRYGT